MSAVDAAWEALGAACLRAAEAGREDDAALAALRACPRDPALAEAAIATAARAAALYRAATVAELAWQAARDRARRLSRP